MVEPGLENNIVGTDVTSTYPASLLQKPKVGRNRDISAEGVLSLRPDILLTTDNELKMKPELASQFSSAGIKLISFSQEYTPKGARKLITQLADSLDLQGRPGLLSAGLKRIRIRRFNRLPDNRDRSS